MKHPLDHNRFLNRMHLGDWVAVVVVVLVALTVIFVGFYNY